MHCMKPNQLALELSKLSHDELAIVMDEWNNITFNERVSQVLGAVRELDLSKRETEQLIKKIQNIAWCSDERKQQKKEEK